MNVSKQVPTFVSTPSPERSDRCEECRGHGVRWTVEKEPSGGRAYCKGWFERCPECRGEGAKEKKKPSWVDFSVEKAVVITQEMIPYDFARNTPENIAWKIGTDKAMEHPGEAAWLASNGVLLIVHGDHGNPSVLSRNDSKITPSVEAKYYAWLCPGILTGPHVELVIEALNEYNAGSET